MKELVITLLEKDKPARVSTCSLVKEALNDMVGGGLISFSTRDKSQYTKEERDEMASVYIKLEGCNEKFMGAFLSWFAYKSGPCKEIEPGAFRFGSRMFSSCLSELGSLTCLMHRIKGMSANGFEGKVYVKISDFTHSVFNNYKDIEIEPMSKHAKYFNAFAELNIYDF